MNKEEAIRRLHTSNYMYQTENITHEQLEIELGKTLDEYAQQVRKVYMRIAFYRGRAGHYENFDTWYDEWINQTPKQ